MKKLILCFCKMEKSASLFIRKGLEVVLYIIFLMLLRVRTASTLYGVEKEVFLNETLECVTYIMLTVTLIVGGGLFMDFALKCDKNAG